MTYQRPPGAAQSDFLASKEFEQQVALHLPQQMIDRTDSTTELDFYVPGWYCDVKEKKQPISKRWPLPAGSPEPDCFILDELSLRKALKHDYMAYFLIRDVPCNRLFLAAAWEVACAERVRVNRGGKGKLVLDMTQFRQLQFLTEIDPMIRQDQIDCRWKRSECISEKGVPQV